MNDHDAMDAVIAVMDNYIYDRITASAALVEIARITGANKIQHEQAKL